MTCSGVEVGVLLKVLGKILVFFHSRGEWFQFSNQVKKIMEHLLSEKCKKNKYLIVNESNVYHTQFHSHKIVNRSLIKGFNLFTLPFTTVIIFYFVNLPQ